MTKADVINLLGKRHDLRSYLEICTPSTGLTFDAVDGSWFTTKHRLVYNSPECEDDGIAYSYRTARPSSLELTGAISAAVGGQTVYDLVFVDPFHTLECSMTDLEGAWRLLNPGGYLVVHDCNPTDPALVNPNFQAGLWCGVTYQAYVDFVLRRTDARYLTVDTDYGCGIVEKQPPAARGTSNRERGDHEALALLKREWMIVREDDARRYAFFGRNRARLLNLVTVEAFIERSR